MNSGCGADAASIPTGAHFLYMPIMHPLVIQTGMPKLSIMWQGSPNTAHLLLKWTQNNSKRSLIYKDLNRIIKGRPIFLLIPIHNQLRHVTLLAYTTLIALFKSIAYSYLRRVSFEFMFKLQTFVSLSFLKIAKLPNFEASMVIIV